MTDKKKQGAVVAVATMLTVTSVLSPVATVYATETDTAIVQQTETEQIKENAPPIELPQELAGFAGQTLQEVALPEGWNWTDETAVISKGITEYLARITVDDETYDYSNVEGYHADGHYVERNVVIAVTEHEPVTENIENLPPISTFGSDLDKDVFSLPKAGNVVINEYTFPDATFRGWVIANVQGAKDEILTPDEIKNITDINLQLLPNGGDIKSLQGIEYFTELKNLNCYATGNASLDVSQNSNLETLQCSDNANLATLNVKGVKTLKKLQCYGTGITALDVSENKALTYLSCHYTKIKELDVSINTELEELYCEGNEELVSLNVNGATALKILNCAGTGISALDVSENKALKSLSCFRAKIKSLDVSKNIVLEELYCQGNPLSWMNVGTNPNLRNFQLTTPTISTNIIADSFNIKDVVKDIDLQKVAIVNNGSIDSNGVISNYDRNQPIQYEYDCGTTANGQTLKLTVNLELAIDINEANFPDSNFRQYVSDNFDTSNPKDGKLTASEINQITKISISDRTDITSLKGIEYFTALNILYCSATGITSLDVSNNKALTELSCYNTKIKSLNVKKNTELTKLMCDRTEIENLDINQNSKLTELRCFGTKIQSLDVSSNTKLAKLYCYKNASLKNLKVDGAVALTILECNDTEIENLDVSHNIALTYLGCYNTPLAYLNIGENNNLQVRKNNLKPVNVKVTSESFNITDKFAGIDKGKISNVTGADYNNGIMSNYNLGTPITYTYACGTSASGKEIINVTLNLTDTRADSTIVVTANLDKPYDGTAVSTYPSITKTGSTGKVSYKWEKKVSDTQWEVITYVPKDAGTYRVTATLASDNDYKGATSKPFEFIISQATNSWTDTLSITGWTYGATANKPTATALFGKVSYLYSDSKNGTYIDHVPTDAGTWYVKATAAGTDNYTGLESIKEFKITKAKDTWLEEPAILDWVFGETANTPTAKAKSGERVIFTYSSSEKGTYTKETPTTAGTWYMKATVADSNNYTGMESIKKFQIAKAKDTWLEEPSILDWVFGETANTPTAKAKSGGKVNFTYSSSEKGTYTDKVPTTAGTWYMKATIDDSDNYKGLESIISFTISPKNAENNNQIIIPDINSDKDVENLVIKDGDKELVKGTDYDVDKKQENNKVIVTITFKGNYAGTVIRTYIVEDKKPSGNPDTNKPSDKNPVVETGDTNTTGIWAMLMTISAGTTALLKGKKCKKKTEE